MDSVTIILSTPEAQMFKDFQQFHEMFALLVKQGVFETQYGKVTLNFSNGQLQTIVKEETVYRRT